MGIPATELNLLFQFLNDHNTTHHSDPMVTIDFGYVICCSYVKFFGSTNDLTACEARMAHVGKWRHDARRGQNLELQVMTVTSCGRREHHISTFPLTDPALLYCIFCSAESSDTVFDKFNVTITIVDIIHRPVFYLKLSSTL
jgi:hypothetical protein